MRVFVLSILTTLIVVTFGSFEQAAAQDVSTKARETSVKEITVKEAPVDEVQIRETQVREDIDISDVTIRMTRDGSSLGCVNCADIYSVSINGAGVVNFEGKVGVKLNGKYTFAIDTEVVRSLVAEFQKIDFFSLEDKYTQKTVKDGMSMTVSHGMKTTTTITLNGKTKSVFNFYGAPDGLGILQDKIDAVVQNIIR